MPWFVTRQTRANTEVLNMYSIPDRPSDRKGAAKKSVLPSQKPRSPQESPQSSSKINDRPRNSHKARPKHIKDSGARNHALSVVRQRRLADAPPRVREHYRRAWAKRSRKSAIRAFCLACVGYSPSEVTNCTAPACSLYEYRLKG